MATAKLGTDIKSAKIHVRVCRSQVTKAIKQFESSGAELQKNEQGSKAKKLRLAAGMLESLEILQTKVKKMEQANDVTIEAILAEDEGKLSKKKEEIVEDYEAENETYMENSRKVQGQLEGLLEKAEEILAEARQEPVNTQASQPATDTAVPAAAAHAQTTSNNDFRPHSSQKPNYLEKSSSHLEVKTFCEQIQAYIITGYRSAPPPQGVWFHIKACMHSTWYTALEQKGALNESLEKILEMLQEESCLRNPVH